MNIITIIGVILIVLGVVGLIYGGITYTSNRNVVDMGSMHVQVTETRQMPLSPIAGAAAVVGGIVLVVVGRRRQTGRSV